MYPAIDSLIYLHMSTTLRRTPPHPRWPPRKRSAMTLVEVSQYAFLRFWLCQVHICWCNVPKCNFALNKPVLIPESMTPACSASSTTCTQNKRGFHIMMYSIVRIDHILRDSYVVWNIIELGTWGKCVIYFTESTCTTRISFILISTFYNSHDGRSFAAALNMFVIFSGIFAYCGKLLT